MTTKLMVVFVVYYVDVTYSVVELQMIIIIIIMIIIIIIIGIYIAPF